MTVHSAGVSKQVALSEAVAAAKLGQKQLARQILHELVERDPRNENAWLWLAALSEDRDQALVALNRVLDINPDNQQAINAMALARLQESARRNKLEPSGAKGQEPAAARILNASVPAKPGINHESYPSHPATAPTGDAGATSTCPFCEALMHRTAVRCVQCGALVGLVSADEYAANKGTNEEKVQAAIRVLLERVSKQESQKARIQLGLAYLNLYRSAEALPQLKRAVELGPRNPALERLTANLADRRLILAVDDSLTVRKIVSITLERRGYSVLTAADGMQALSRLGETAPDLVLLDITMPRMDGYQVCKAIRQHPATKRIPVVMLSGKDGFFDKVKGKLVGATDYITKPFREERLLDAIEKYAPRKMRAS